jgi:hypothetical protein
MLPLGATVCARAERAPGALWRCGERPTRRGSERCGSGELAAGRRWRLGRISEDERKSPEHRMAAALPFGCRSASRSPGDECSSSNSTAARDSHPVSANKKRCCSRTKAGAPAIRALQDGRPEVKRGASGVESESLRDTAAMRPHRGLMRHRRESFSTGATATDSPLDGATRRAR